MNSLTTEKAAAAEIRNLHDGIAASMRRCVPDAIRIGEILAEQKEHLGHGNFLAWVKGNLPFGDDTARNYVRLFENADKIRNVRNLQEAYQTVDAIETREKQAEARAREKRIEQAEKTGEKPDDWTRSDDYALKKKRDAEAFNARMAEAEKEEPARGPAPDVDDLLRKADEAIEDEKKHSKLAMTGIENYAQKGIFVAIEKYIDSFDTTARKLEAAHNIIKKVKIIAASLQAKSSGEGGK